MKIIIWINCFILISFTNAFAQNPNDARASMLTANSWRLDQCYIDSMLYPKPIDVISKFYPDGNFNRAKRDTLYNGPIWNFVSSNQLSITYSNATYNELYDILFLEPGILILKNQRMGSDQNMHTIEYRYKPYIND